MNLLTSTLAQNPKYYKKTLQLIEKNFKYDVKNSFAVDFYPLVEEKNLHNCHILIDEKKEKVIAHVGVIIKKMSFKNNIFPVAFIGGIAVSEDYQGQGFFKKLFALILLKYETEVLFFFLWSDLADLYSKYNFFQVGGQRQLGNKDISQYEGNLFSKHKLSELCVADFVQIKKLYQERVVKNSFAIKRTENDWEQLKKIVSANFYLYKNANEVVGYFVVNKGADLTNIIHEFVCTSESEQFLLKSLAEYKLWLPENYSNYSGAIDTFLYIGMCRIANETLFLKFIQQVTSPHLLLKTIEQKTQTIGYFFNGTNYKETFQGLLQNIWGPNSTDQNGFIPYPLYISGLDSI